MPPLVCSQASCMKRPRCATRRRPVSKSKVPAAACAVNSPSERPAAAWMGNSPISARSAARQARPWTKSAGWQCFVCVSSSSGPGEGDLAQRIAEDFVGAGRRAPAAAGYLAARSWPMPTVWAPWPAKRSAMRLSVHRMVSESEEARGAGGAARRETPRRASSRRRGSRVRR